MKKILFTHSLIVEQNEIEENNDNDDDDANYSLS